jgi:hypothetical protein
VVVENPQKVTNVATATHQHTAGKLARVRCLLEHPALYISGRTKLF